MHCKECDKQINFKFGSEEGKRKGDSDGALRKPLSDPLLDA
jgi:hypothetical protein